MIVIIILLLYIHLGSVNRDWTIGFCDFIKDCVEIIGNHWKSLEIQGTIMIIIIMIFFFLMYFDPQCVHHPYLGRKAARVIAITCCNPKDINHLES